MSMYILFFFFSSRRRHTRSLRDWSSDVCSSDLMSNCDQFGHRESECFTARCLKGKLRHGKDRPENIRKGQSVRRSEERRVGKECRYRWSLDHYKKNISCVC